MANIDNIKDIVDTFYKIKKGISSEELYRLCDSSTKEEIDNKVLDLIELKLIKWNQNKLVPVETI